MESNLISRLSALSHPQRLSVFRLLMRRYPDEIPAGEIADTLALKGSTTSVYLSALTQADLITQRRDGTRLLYAVNLAATRDVVGDLFQGCCRGRPDLCPPSLAGPDHVFPLQTDRKLNVLFVCSRNSARSLFAEAILRDLAGSRFNAYSAGTARHSVMNPDAVKLLTVRGHDTALLRSKNVDTFTGAAAPCMDFVITVCDRAANQDGPPYAGQPLFGHWGIADPVQEMGTVEDRRARFEQSYGALRARIAAFAALPFNELERALLQVRMDEIGRFAGKTE